MSQATVMHTFYGIIDFQCSRNYRATIVGEYRHPNGFGENKKARVRAYRISNLSINLDGLWTTIRNYDAMQDSFLKIINQTMQKKLLNLAYQ